jgi:amino-acid N-acetyltransferase
MNRDTEITSTNPEDLNAVLILLADAALPQEGVHEHFQHFLVARGDGRVIGSVGMERYGLSALLRSLAVAPAYRGQGLGRALVERLLQEAREQGVKRIFLLTETAPEFFPRFGFRRIAREETDVVVQQSVEFRTACCQSAVCMRLNL